MAASLTSGELQLTVGPTGAVMQESVDKLNVLPAATQSFAIPTLPVDEFCAPAWQDEQSVAPFALLALRIEDVACASVIKHIIDNKKIKAGTNLLADVLKLGFELIYNLEKIK